MKNKELNHSNKYLHKYNLLIAGLIVLAVVVIAGVWVWYGHKSEQLEKEIYLLK